MAKEAAKKPAAEKKAADKPRPMSKAQVASHLAEKTEASKKQAVGFLDELAALAYREAKKTFKGDKGDVKSVGFTVPGLGKLILVDRKERIGRNPRTGEQIKIKARRVVRFRVAKAAKEAIAGTKK